MLVLSGAGCVCSVLDFFIVVPIVLRCPTKLITREKLCLADLTVCFATGGPAAHKLDQVIRSNTE